jgi:hypothetical protein
MKIMLIMLVTGLAAAGSGLYLLLLTNLANDGGLRGIFIIVTLITIGLVLLIPAKIYIIIQLMKREPATRNQYSKDN